MAKQRRIGIQMIILCCLIPSSDWSCLHEKFLMTCAQVSLCSPSAEKMGTVVYPNVGNFKWQWRDDDTCSCNQWPCYLKSGAQWASTSFFSTFFHLKLKPKARKKVHFAFVVEHSSVWGPVGLRDAVHGFSRGLSPQERLTQWPVPILSSGRM